jgi:UDP-N-acetyl-D-mannosaminuronic acid dehydrogenase
LIVVSDVEQAFDDVDAVLIHTDHPAFASLKLGVLAGRMRKPGLIYDFWNIFTETGVVLPEEVHYLSLGSVRRSLAAAGLAGG